MAKRRPKASRSSIDLSISKLIRLATEFRLVRWEQHFPGQLPVAIAGLDEAPLSWSVALMDDREISGEYAIILLRGPRSCRSYAEFIRTSDTGYFDPIEGLVLSYAPLDELPPSSRRFLEKGGLRAGPTQLVPDIRRREAKGQEHPLRASEVRLFSRALELLDRARSLGDWGDHSAVESGEAIFELAAPSRKEVTIEERPLPSREAMGVPDAPIQLPKSLRGPVSETSGLAVSTELESEGDRVETHVCLFEAETRYLLEEFLLRGDQRRLSMAAWTEFLDLFRELELALPREVVFSDAVTRDAARESLEALGIRSRIDPEHPAFLEQKKYENAIDVLDQCLELDSANGMTPLAWRMLHDRWRSQLRSRFEGFDGPEPIEKYFGTEDVAKLAELMEIEAIASSYDDWFIFDFESTADGKTPLESALENPTLRKLDRMMLEAQRDATIGRYRLEEVLPSGQLSLRDTITDAMITIEKFRSEHSHLVGGILFLRIASVAGVNLGSIAGPAKLAAPEDDANELWRQFLETSGGTRPGDFRVAPHALGRLWEMTHKPDAPVESSESNTLPASDRFRPLPGRLSWSGDERADEPTENAVLGLPSPEPALDTVGFSDGDIEIIASKIREVSLRWLDEEHPELDDRTPRAAVQSEEGRRQVLELIDAIPEPIDEPRIARALDFATVRARMREILGIDGVK